ncbi:MAG: TetR/AcrR family transcriptional regulator, partial [Nitrospirales bacterium]
KGTFYQYFDTKEALLQALLAEGLTTLLNRTIEAVGHTPPGPQAVSQIVQAHLDFYLENPEYLLLFHQVRGLLQLTIESAKGLREVYDEYLTRLGAVLRQGLNGQGEAGPSGRKLALALSAFSTGLLTYHLVFDRSGDFKHQRQQIQQELEHSIRAILSSAD